MTLKEFNLKYSCCDGGCVFGHPGGMHTNGGCDCLYKPDFKQRAKIDRGIRELRNMVKDLEYNHEYFSAQLKMASDSLDLVRKVIAPADAPNSVAFSPDWLKDVVLESTIERVWKEGNASAQLDNQNNTKTECPYGASTVENNWWTRGYASTMRLFRAINAGA